MPIVVMKLRQGNNIHVALKCDALANITGKERWLPKQQTHQTDNDYKKQIDELCNKYKQYSYISYYWPDYYLVKPILQFFGLWTFFKFDADEKRFSSKPYENVLIKTEGKPDQLIVGDSYENFVSEYVVIPSLEDGNESGLSERAIAEEWFGAYKQKKVLHQELEAQHKAIIQKIENKISDIKLKIEKLNNSLATIDKVPTEKNKTSQQELIKLQDELTIATHEKEKKEIEMEEAQRISREYPGYSLTKLNCASMVYKLLQKGDIHHKLIFPKQESMMQDDLIFCAKNIREQVIKSNKNVIDIKPELKKLTAEQEAQIFYAGLESIIRV